MSINQENEHLVFTPEEFAAEIGFSVSFVKHLVKKNAFPLREVDGTYHLTAQELDEIKEQQRKDKEELHNIFANRDENRRKLIRRLAGVDDETAESLGY
jgi:hypothetical protein